MRQVSSANSLGFVDEMLAILLMYKVKRKGPKTESCGTPQLIILFARDTIIYRMHL